MYRERVATGTASRWGLVLLIGGLLLPIGSNAYAGITERVSLASGGTEGNGPSWDWPSINSDGRFVAFDSDASNLVPDDTNLERDVFVHDRQTGQTERVSLASDGTEANYESGGPSISSDGRFVAFSSWASNLVPDDTNGEDVFVHDRQTGQTERVSLASDGTEANSFSHSPSINSDGRFVAFASFATNLVPDDSIYTYDVFVHDRQTGQTEHISLASVTEGIGDSSNPSINSDGRFVAFSSYASTLVPDDTNHAGDVFVHDRQTGQTERVSLASDGTEAIAGSCCPSINSDGRFVAFVSEASNLVSDDTNLQRDVFVHDRQTGQTERVSLASGGTEANDQSLFQSISSDGRFVAFRSDASNLVPDDTNNRPDVFVHDRQTGQTERVSLASDGTEANGESRSPSINYDGRFVAFDAWASNLVPDDTNRATDVFVHDRNPSLLSVSPNGGFQVLVPPGGAPSPTSQTYVMRNPGGSALDFRVSTTAPWLDVDPTEGRLSAGGETGIRVSANADVRALAPDQVHQSELRFDNLSRHANTTERTISALVLDDTETGWTVSTSEGYDDSTSLVAEGVPANATAELKLIVDAPATPRAALAAVAAAASNLNLAFQVRTAIGPDDGLTVSIGGEVLRQWSGNNDWDPACIPLSACPQLPCEVSFELTSRSNSSGRAAYVDNVTTAPDVRPIAAVLPGSRSAQVGQPVTAFSTLINSGAETGQDCAIRPVTPVSGTFSYQITDPATNRPVGTADVPHDVPGDSAQSFVFAFTPDAVLNPTDVELRFDCANSCGPSPVVRGVNTFLLSASEHPVPDIVALGATLDGDGIVKIPGANGTGIFAVASVNVGAAGSIRVSLDTGGVMIPVDLFVCETEAQTGACLADPADDVRTEIATNATPTFGIFVRGRGQVPFNPSQHRVFVRFRDRDGVVRGATSVAVRTQ